MKIKVDTANEILANFGISRPSRNYERWCRGDHFLLEDFDEVLFESKYIRVFDWRGSLGDELEDLISLMPDFGLTLEAEISECGTSAVINCGTESREVRYLPAEESDFNDVLRALNDVTPDKIEFRTSKLYEGSDSWLYAVNGPEEWGEVDEIAPEVISHFFQKLQPEMSQPDLFDF